MTGRQRIREEETDLEQIRYYNDSVQALAELYRAARRGHREAEAILTDSADQFVAHAEQRRRKVVHPSDARSA